MARPELGTKRICPSCNARFYDLEKRPIECPKCHFSFEPEVLLKTRRSRAPKAEPEAKASPKAKKEAPEPEAPEEEVEEEDIEEVDLDEEESDDEDTDDTVYEGDEEDEIDQGDDDEEEDEEASAASRKKKGRRKKRVLTEDDEELPDIGDDDIDVGGDDGVIEDVSDLDDDDEEVIGVSKGDKDED